MPKTQSNLAQHQKNNRLFRRNNRLFIQVHKYKLNLKSSRDREIAHTDLYWFTLKPRATSSLPRNHWGIDGNQVEKAQAHEAQAQQGAQAQRITRSMARALGQEYQRMALLISFIE